MSDITKKILSIEPEVEPISDDIIRSVTPANAPKPASSHASDIPSLRRSPANPETFPDFISRDDSNRRNEGSAQNRQIETTQYAAQAPKTAWIMWTGIALTLIWIAASLAVYFGLFEQNLTALTPLALSGLILAVLLPAVLITLLWATWKRLAHMSYEAGRVAHAAHLLTRADETALTNTRNLAVGIQSELSHVDEQLGKMLSRFETLKNDITAHSQDINKVGLTLTERSDDVGRNLTLQRQALESITSTFDTRMETLGSTIETQSLKLSEVTQTATKNIETAQQTLNQASETLDKSSQSLSQTSQDVTQNIESSTQNLNTNHEQLSGLNEKITDLIGALTTQQDKIKSELLTQSENLQDMSNMAKGSTDALQHSLSLGSDILTALTSATQGTQDAVQKRYADMETMIGQTQERADAVAEAANTRVRNSLSETRKDLSKLETDMQVLQSQIANAREESAQLDLDALDRQDAKQAGFGRLRLTPLETDFPPVQPPRFPSRERPVKDDISQDDILQNNTQTPLNFDNLPVSNVIDETTGFDAPINLGADMEIVNPDDEITGFDTDNIREEVLRPAAPISKGFGQAKTNKTRDSKAKAKTGWHWRDMLGGLERPDTTTEQAAPLANPLQAQPLSAPPSLPLNEDIIHRLTDAQLSPAAVVDEGTIIEAAKARISNGPAAMLKTVETRLASPVAHLRMQLSQDMGFTDTAKRFVTQYGQTLAQASPHDKALRDKLGTSEGRAYLLCAAALS